MPFAVDALAIVVPANSVLTTNFTPAFLNVLYACSLPPAVQNQYRPLLPPEGTGTRLNFLRFIGLTTTGPCVSDRDPTNPSNPLIEHVGNVLTDPRHLVPQSIAQHNAQTSGATFDNTGTTKMRRINGVIPNIDNLLFIFRFPVFNVIPTQNATQPDPTGVAQGADPAYGPVFVGNNSTICANPNVIRRNCFFPLRNPDPDLPPGNTGCGDTISIRTGGLGIVTGPPAR